MTSVLANPLLSYEVDRILERSERIDGVYFKISWVPTWISARYITNRQLRGYLAPHTHHIHGGIEGVRRRYRINAILGRVEREGQVYLKVSWLPTWIPVRCLDCPTMLEEFLTLRFPRVCLIYF